MGRSGLAVVALAAVAVAGCSSAGHATRRGTPVAVRTTAVPSTAAPSTPTPAPSTSSTTAPATKPSPTPTTRPPTPRPSPTAASHRPAAAAALPLRDETGSARQVITVVAPSTSSTRAVLQAWRRVTGGWRRVGPAVSAWLGSDGLSAHPSESRSATPIGSFTLTQAFGHDADPGTALHYVQTTPADWWISEPGPLYNTRQHCTGNCPFTRGDPNEHLYYETPYYDYAVVIDYNTRNAPGGVRQGAGSAFFLHVTVGQPTAGCVSIDADQLVRILRWLRPAQHPRILIGPA